MAYMAHLALYTPRCVAVTAFLFVEPKVSSAEYTGVQSSHAWVGKLQFTRFSRPVEAVAQGVAAVACTQLRGATGES